MATDYANEVKNAFSDPLAVVKALGLTQKSKRQARGFLVCCPVHGEKDPSCSVTVAPSGTIRVKCFACDFSGDVLTLVSAVFGIKDFRECLWTAAQLAGHYDLSDEIRGNQPNVRRKPVPVPEPKPETEYPNREEMQLFWDRCGDIDRNGEIVGMLHGRGIDFQAVARLGLGRSLPSGLLPRFATHERVSWGDSGHSLILRTFDARGAFRSVRAWCVKKDTTAPKRLPPSGLRSAGLVLCNRESVAMLQGKFSPYRVVICEGEPDFLVACTTFAMGDAVFGIGSGWWTKEHAVRIPSQSEIIIATHDDRAGEMYAKQILTTLPDSRRVWRWKLGGL